MARRGSHCSREGGRVLVDIFRVSLEEKERKKEKDDGRYLETLSKGASDLFVLMFTRWSFDNCLSKLSKSIDRKKLIIIDNDAISFHK